MIAVAAAIVILEVPTLCRDRRYKDMLAFAVLLICGISLSIALSLYVRLQTPLDWITRLYHSFI